RQQGVCVYPVQVPGLPIDFDALPRWMRDSHFYTLDREWETFVNYLKSPCTAPKVPFMPPDLPEHFVPRPREFDALKSQLLDANFDNPVAITTALKGAGGFGKTTLAAALCHDEDVQTAFDDGVLWVTLGETPDIVAALSKLYRALTDDNPGFIDIEEGATKLSEKLVDLDCLIVIDDVWNSAHLKPFLRGGARCARLVTTRDAGIAARESAKTTDVDEMTLAESVALLGAGLDGLDPLRLERIAKRLGDWALLLEIANGQLRERVGVAGDTPERALDWLERLLDKRGITGIKRDDEEARKRDAAGVLGGTLGLLDDDARERLCDMVVFKDDENVPLSSVGALWGLDEFDTEDMVLRFAKLSLLRYSSSTGSIRLHDVIREYLGTQVADMCSLHVRLIDAYGDLTTLPDNYAWRNIAYHLTGAGRADRLRGLLLDYAFLQAKLDTTDANALIADCDYLLDDEVIRLVKSALSMSAHVLIEHKDQLPYQLTGRLWTHRDQPDIAPLWRTTHGITPLELLETQTSPPMLQAGGALLRTLVDHTNSVCNVLDLKDGRLLSWTEPDDFSISEDYTLRLWALNGNLLQVLEGHTDYIDGVIVLANGWFLSWSGGFSKRDNTLRLWDSEGNFITSLKEQPGLISGGVSLDDGRLLTWSQDTGISDLFPTLSSEPDHAICIWSTEGELLTTLKENIKGALALNNGGFLSWDRYNIQLRLPDGEIKAVLAGHTDWILGVQALKDGRFLSWSQDATLRLWSSEGVLLTVLQGHSYGINGALILTDGHFLSWSWNEIRLWSNQGDLIAFVEGHTDLVKGMLELSDGRFLSWSADNTLRLWSDGGKLLTILDAQQGNTSSIDGALELEDGRLLSWSGDIFHIWSSGGELLKVLAGHTSMINGVLPLENGNILSWSRDRTLRIWTADGKAVEGQQGEHDDLILGLQSLKGGHFLSWSFDNTLRLWSSEGKALSVLEGHAGAVTDVLILDDGRFISWADDILFFDHVSGDYTMRLWSPAGELLAVLDDRRSDETRLAWIKEYGINVQGAYKGGLENSNTARIGNDRRLLVNNAGQFIGDADFWTLAMRGQTVVAGDEIGRIIFLRVRGEGES
ncbi:MAG: hypothetical protein EA396_00075, partial [Anaerolineaceae bacterium]